MRKRKHCKHAAESCCCNALGGASFGAALRLYFAPLIAIVAVSVTVCIPSPASGQTHVPDGIDTESLRFSSGPESEALSRYAQQSSEQSEFPIQFVRIAPFSALQPVRLTDASDSASPAPASDSVSDSSTSSASSSPSSGSSSGSSPSIESADQNQCDSSGSSSLAAKLDALGAGDVDLPSEAQTLLDSITPYGSIRVRMLMTQKRRELQNGTSRLGFNLHRELASCVAFTGCAEWQIRLSDDPTLLAPNGNTNGTLLQAQPSNAAFATRLGWLGFDFKEYGTFQFGKQWSVYNDVAGPTGDVYAFGSAALGIFTANTDGGPAGTGRAEQALIYRLENGPISLGFQYQPTGTKYQDLEGIGGALRYRPWKWLELGTAFNHARLGALASAIDHNASPRTIVGAMRIITDGFTLCLAYAKQRQNELGRINDQPTLLDAKGYESYLYYTLTKNTHLFGGTNWLDADDDGFDSRHDVDDYYLGADWFFNDSSFAYIQGRLAEGIGTNALVIGIRYNF